MYVYVEENILCVCVPGSVSDPVLKEGQCVLVELVLLIQGLGSRREREGELVGL